MNRWGWRKSEVTGRDFPCHLSSVRAEEGEGTRQRSTVREMRLIRAPTSAPTQAGPSGTRRILPVSCSWTSGMPVHQSWQSCQPGSETVWKSKPPSARPLLLYGRSVLPFSFPRRPPTPSSVSLSFPVSPVSSQEVWPFLRDSCTRLEQPLPGIGLPGARDR